MSTANLSVSSLPLKERLDQLLTKAPEFILDKSLEVKLALTCLLAKGHLLIEDRPGVGKTTMAQILAQMTGLPFSRIQFTSDLLPADILGNYIFNDQSHTFQFHPGPLFNCMVLADELNRANPRTQSALLQAMEEAEVSLDGKTQKLPEPFFLIATQNPQNQVGVFPLPESQIDRFLMSFRFDVPTLESEILLIQGFNPREQIKSFQPLFNPQDMQALQKQVSEVFISRPLALYITRLLEATRSTENPLSTRAGIALGRASQAWAFISGRKSVLPEDVQAIAVSVLGHRMGKNMNLQKGSELAKKLLQEVAVPH